MINWDKLNKEDITIIDRICKRAVNLFPQYELDFTEIQMDIAAAHVAEPLDLEKFMEFDDFNFAHDIFGIIDHIDRETGKMQNCFLPRCSK